MEETTLMAAVHRIVRRVYVQHDALRAPAVRPMDAVDMDMSPGCIDERHCHWLLIHLGPERVSPDI